MSRVLIVPIREHKTDHSIVTAVIADADGAGVATAATF